jgi:hypothetical protein
MCRDVRTPLPETVSLVDDIVTEYIIEMVCTVHCRWRLTNFQATLSLSLSLSLSSLTHTHATTIDMACKDNQGNRIDIAIKQASS